MPNSKPKSNKKAKRQAWRRKIKNYQPFRTFITNALYYTIKPIFILIMKLAHNVRYKRNGHKLPKGPVLFLSNHMSNWDGPYMLGFSYFKTMYFVVNEELFANKFFRFFTSYLLQFIKRASSLTDLSHVMEMKRYVRRGRSIGIYPEGDIGMFGDGLPIDESIAKLAKMLDIPVVCTKITGANLRAPRTIKKTRRSKITYNITDIISLDDVRNLSKEDLHARMVNNLHHDEREWQKTAMVKLGRRHQLAEHYEQGLFLCPSCGQYETLKSDDNTVSCQNCNFAFDVNRYDQFAYHEHPNKEIPFFINGADWNHWQLEALKKKIDNWEDVEQPLFIRENLYFQRVGKGEIFQPYNEKHAAQCSIAFFINRLEIVQSSGEIITINFNGEVERCLVQYKAVYEIDYNETRLRIFSKGTDFAAHMYIEATRHILNKNNVIISLK